MDEDYSAFVRARWPRLVRSAVMLGCSVQEAEDVVQTTLVRCYRHWSKVTQAADPDAYVYRILVNVWAKSRRRRWWGEQPTDVVPDSPAVDDLGESLTSRRAVVAALSRLSEQHRTVLVLRYVADMSEKRVAEVLAVPQGTVKSRLSRALTACAADPTLVDLWKEQP